MRPDCQCAFDGMDEICVIISFRGNPEDLIEHFTYLDEKDGHLFVKESQVLGPGW